MKRTYIHTLSRPLKMLTILAITATLAGGLSEPTYADRSPWVNDAKPKVVGSPVSVYFENLNVLLYSQPVNRNGTVLIQAAPLLRGLGYQVTWDAKAKKLSAVQNGTSSLTLWEDRSEVLIDNQIIKGLPVSPFAVEDELWVPLRFIAQNCGLLVNWNAQTNSVTVRNPNDLINLSVGTRADNDITEIPMGLVQYMKTNWNTNAQINLTKSKDSLMKTRIKIAAGDMESLMLLADSNEFKNDLLQSIALDLTKDLQSYPNLQKLIDNPKMLVRKIEGKTYGIPRPADLNDAAFPALRQDWLDKLQLKQPVTMDEMFDVLKQLVNKDPDGDGINNTIGILGYVNASNLGSLSWVEHAFTGSPERFSISPSGTVVDQAMSQGQHQALEWLKRANAAGLINRDFATLDTETAMQGITKGNVSLAVLRFDDAAKLTLDKKGVWTPVSGLKASANTAEIAPWSSTGGGMYIVSSMTRLEPNKLLQWLDKGIEMTETGAWNHVKGLSDVDYSAIQNLFGRTNILTSNSQLEALPSETRAKYEQAAGRWHQITYAGQTLPEANQLWNQGLYADSINQLNEMKIKVVMGKLSLSDWDKYIKKLSVSAEYKTMIKDLNKLILTK